MSRPKKCIICGFKDEELINKQGLCDECSCRRCHIEPATHGIDEPTHCIDCYSAACDWAYERAKDGQYKK